MDNNFIEHGYEFLHSFSSCGSQLLERQGSLVLSLLNLGCVCVFYGSPENVIQGNSELYAVWQVPYSIAGFWRFIWREVCVIVALC